MKNLLIVFFSITWILVSCSQDTKSREEKRASIVSNNSTVSAQQTALYKAPAEYLQDRKVIKTGNIAFTVKDIDETESFIKTNAGKFGAYISQESIEEWYGNSHHILDLKIPAENFDALLAAISSHAGELDKKDISSEDVTEEYVDVTARVKSMQELEARYFELLKQCKTVDEMLNIEKELANVRQNIETAQGRLNYIDKRSAYSSLRIEFYLQPATASDGKPGYFQQLGHSFSKGWEDILSFTVSLATVWPMLILMAAGLFFLRRMLGKRIRSVKPAVSAASE